MKVVHGEDTGLKPDYVTFGIAAAAIIMFVAHGSMVLPKVFATLLHGAPAPDFALVNALLLNIALVVMGWRRHRILSQQLAEHIRSEREARELAQIDPLTGCLNRRNALEMFDAMIANGQTRSANVAIFVLDLDNFKQVNDLNGHNAGDDVLVETVARLRASLPDNAAIARLGGDEFACAIAFGAEDHHRVDAVAARIIDAFGDPFRGCEGAPDITCSLGIASNGGHPMAGSPPARRFAKANALELLHWADIAMYHAKKQGKNRFAWFEAAMEIDLQYRSELERGIRDGLANGEFVPYYEQQIDIATGELTGFEMLARWHSPELGTVAPDIFIPVAEDMGAIAALSEHLMAQAFEDAKGWASHLSLSVNISQVQLRDPLFAQKILKLLIQHNFPPSRLDIEITESSLQTDTQAVRTIIDSLRNQGIRISLDDFGTGYSSLSQLKSLPVDRIKIDRSFVSSLRDQDSDSTIINAIMSLGDGLKMPITAEGIESVEILERLKQLGKLSGQGYHYGRPEDGKTVTQRLSAAGLLADREPRDSDTEQFEVGMFEREVAPGGETRLKSA